MFSQVSPFPIIFLSLVILISDSSSRQGEARSAAQALFLFPAVPHPCPSFIVLTFCAPCQLVDYSGSQVLLEMQILRPTE